MITYETFLQNLDLIEQNIENACKRSGRQRSSVTLLPITKTHPVEIIKYVVQSGLESIGENRVQEAVEKKLLLGSSSSLKWELVGHLQSNKVLLAIETFDRIQTIDNEKLLRKLHTAATIKNKNIPILIQVNAGKDPAKFGVELENVDKLLELALTLKNIQVDGLMTIPPLSADIAVAERTFDTLRNTRDRLIEQFKVPLPHLSMGMSNDYVQAIEAGSTIIRIGKRLLTSI